MLQRRRIGRIEEWSEEKKKKVPHTGMFSNRDVKCRQNKIMVPR